MSLILVNDIGAAHVYSWRLLQRLRASRRALEAVTALRMEMSKRPMPAPRSRLRERLDDLQRDYDRDDGVRMNAEWGA